MKHLFRFSSNKVFDRIKRRAGFGRRAAASAAKRENGAMAWIDFATGFGRLTAEPPFLVPFITSHRTRPESPAVRKPTWTRPKPGMVK